MRTKIMGVLNVTADSFSDGGRYLDYAKAVEHALTLVEQGADIIDVGGESTRPGSTRVPEDEEIARVVPVVEKLVSEGVTVSVDTMRASTMERALDVGAHIINDVSAGKMDSRMFDVAAKSDAELIVMHWRGLLTDARATHTYDDVVAEVRDELLERADAALEAGVKSERIILDPGLGFAKDAEHNWQLMAGIDEFNQLGYRLLVAGSRKRFLASLINPDNPAAASEADRDAATAAITAVSARAGAWAVRVHDARTSYVAAAVCAAIDKAGHDYQLKKQRQ